MNFTPLQTINFEYDVEVGDTLLDENRNEHKVLKKLQYGLQLSDDDNFSFQSVYYYTFTDLKKKGYALKPIKKEKKNTFLSEDIPTMTAFQDIVVRFFLGNKTGKRFLANFIKNYLNTAQILKIIKNVETFLSILKQ